MAKDGTNRGGSRPGAGRKKKELSIKIAEGQVLGTEGADLQAPDFVGAEMPKPAAFLKKRQHDGKPIGAVKVYEDLWNWVNDHGCADLIRKEKLEALSVCYARFMQCERAISEYGLLGKHPTTGGAIASPYVAMSKMYLDQANRLWEEIALVVRQHSDGGAGEDDPMERLLRNHG